MATETVQQEDTCTECLNMSFNVDTYLTVFVPTQTVQLGHTHTECHNIPLNVNVTPSETITNPTPINVQPHSDINAIEGEECASTDFWTEIMSGMKSRNQKLFNCKVKLKNVIPRIDKLTMSTYTLLDDDKSCEEI